MLPVVAGFHPAETTQMTGDHGIVGDEVNPFRINPDADHLPDPFARRRVAIPVEGDQAGARHLAERFDVAVKRDDHRHQVRRKR